jgi:hypothetical protein
MDLKFDYDGILKAEGLGKYKRDFQAQLLTATRKAMQKVGAEYKTKIQNDARKSLKITRQPLIKSFSYKVYYKRSGRIPSLHFYSRVPWMGIHDKGGIIRKGAIPLSKKHIGYKTLKDIFLQLSRAKNLFFEKQGSYTIAWSKNTEAQKRLLAPFRSVTRAKQGKVVRKDERVNVAIITSSRIRKRLNMTEIVKSSLPVLSKEIEKQFKIVKNK